MGQYPYPFCQSKCQSDVLDGWVGKNIFIIDSEENIISKEKI